MTVIFSSTTFADDTGNNGFTQRSLITPNAGSSGQIRVTYRASSILPAHFNNCSVGISAGNGDTTATPLELLFTTDPNGGVGGHGFNGPANSIFTSDWLSFNWNNGDTLVFPVDMFNGPAGSSVDVSAPTVGAGNDFYYHASASSYLTQIVSGSGYSHFVGAIYAVSMIETQSGTAALSTTTTPRVVLLKMEDQ